MLSPADMKNIFNWGKKYRVDVRQSSVQNKQEGALLHSYLLISYMDAGWEIDAA